MSRPTTPPLTVDLILRVRDDSGRPGIVLVERRNPPHGWALPGGFVDVGERIEEAALREGFEETGLRARLVALVGVYSDPGRDPRGHTVSVVFLADAEGEPRGGDDARQARVFPIDALPPLAFDHARIVADWLAGHTPVNPDAGADR